MKFALTALALILTASFSDACPNRSARVHARQHVRVARSHALAAAVASTPVRSAVANTIASRPVATFFGAFKVCGPGGCK